MFLFMAKILVTKKQLFFTGSCLFYIFCCFYKFLSVQKCKVGLPTTTTRATHTVPWSGLRRRQQEQTLFEDLWHGYECRKT